jgi:type I restriction enzyme S subunit
MNWRDSSERTWGGLGMSSEWKTVKLGEVIEINQNNYSHTDNWDYINYLDTGNIYENIIENIQYLDVKKDKIPSRAKRKVNANDIVYSTVRPNQKHYGIIKRPLKNMLVSTGFAVINGKDKFVDNRFLYWYLSQENVMEVLHAIAEQSASAYPSIKPGDIEGLSISLPPLSEQKAISDILTVIDAKIELNNRTNQTLEAMAQAIFKYWFIDFEPLQDGEFVASELGLIPQGWEVRTIGDVLDIKGGSTPSTKENGFWNNGNINWTTPKDLAKIRYSVLLHTERKITALGLKEISGGLLPKGAVLFSSRAPIGYLAITEIPTALNQGIIGIECNDQIPNYYFLLWLKNNRDVIKNRANGSTFLEISKTNFKAIKLVVPDRDTILHFKTIVENLFKMIIENEKENETLVNLRDSLLPKLMSGEIWVAAF